MKRKPDQGWNGEERRHGPSDDYKGEERRKEAMQGMPGGNPQGGNPGAGPEDPKQ